MITTTLMTFMVRTPPTTRQVTLHGSWDNFSKPYPMHRDSRVGREHWSGCHNFSNIICDGNIVPDGQPRHGGLKMGGTYWYYYRLDDDIDFHNSAEPSTTLCPLLPGQLVNVLQVPVALSGNRSRSGSASSTSSEIRTMIPADKFMNPRPVPKPGLPRLKTSPTLTSSPWSSNSSPSSSASGRAATSGEPFSFPNSAGTLKRICLSRRASFDRSTRSTSPASSISDGIKLAFRSLLPSRPHSPSENLAQSYFDISSPQDLNASRNGHIDTPYSSRSVSPITTSDLERFLLEQTSDLALRRPAAHSETRPDAAPLASFQQHRRQRSQSREPSSLRNSMTMEDSSISKLIDISTRRPLALDTLKEVASAQNTPGLPITAIKDQAPVLVTVGQGQADLEKRLPTLPNTPSSAYPPSSAADDSPGRRLSLEIANLESHFSCTTIDTDTSQESPTRTSRLCLSHWSAHYSTGSQPCTRRNSLVVEEQTYVSVIEPCYSRGRQMPEGTLAFAENRTSLKPGNLSSTESSSTISSTASSAFTTSPVLSQDNNGGFNSNSSDPALKFNRFQHYSLPADEHGSEITLKPVATSEKSANDGRTQPYILSMHRRESSSHSQSTLAHSVNMQQLLHELRYLGDVIQQT